MGYAPVSRGFHSHVKVLRLGRHLDALTLWILALSWVTDQETDGQVPTDVVRRLVGARSKVWAESLVRVGLWEGSWETGFAFHDFLDWQKSHNELAELRASKRRAGYLGGLASAQARASAHAQGGASSTIQPASPPLRYATPHCTSTTPHDIETEPKSKAGTSLARFARVSPTSPPGFIAFWQAYPKKVGKDAALKAWQHKDCEPHAADVMAGLTKQTKYLNREGGKYIPNPATWLNQGRWQDDPPLNGHMRGFGNQDMSGLEAFLESHKHDLNQEYKA